jgi:hypothetical protein
MTQPFRYNAKAARGVTPARHSEDVMTSMTRLALLAVAALAVAACNTRPITIPGEAPAQVTPNVFNQSLNNKADILFMIDNSNSMEPKQESLKQYFPNFMTPLKSLPTLPDLHLGIITSDLGAGQFTPPSCDTIGGDQGMLQNDPKGTTCAAAKLNNAADRFLIFRPNGSGGTDSNFSGDVSDAFACYASVGTGGCGFEHQLASVRAALDGCQEDAGCKQRSNANFFRQDAYLAVVYLTDEDDCSGAPNSTLFDPTQTQLNSALGPLTSYRCFEFGSLCGGQDVGRAQGPRQECEAGNKDSNPLHQLTPVEEFAAAMKALKPQDPRMVYVSVIGAPPAPTAVGLDQQGYPDLQPSCTGALGSGDPGIRLTKFVAQFDPDRASFISLCAQDLKAGLAQIANELATVLGRQCLTGVLRDQDATREGLQPHCVVHDRIDASDAEGSANDRSVPACDPVVCDPVSAPNGDCRCQQHPGASPTAPCWFLWRDEAACPTLDPARPVAELRSVGSGHRIWVDRGTDDRCVTPAAPAATRLIVQCAACLANPSADQYDCSPGCAELWPDCCPVPRAGCYP